MGSGATRKIRLNHTCSVVMQVIITVTEHNSLSLLPSVLRSLLVHVEGKNCWPFTKTCRHDICSCLPRRRNFAAASTVHTAPSSRSRPSSQATSNCSSSLMNSVWNTNQVAAHCYIELLHCSMTCLWYCWLFSGHRRRYCMLFDWCLLK